MVEKIIDKPIADIIHESFIEYAKEVIEDRALPDVRDGLNQYSAGYYIQCINQDLHQTNHLENLATVGEVLKNLHPHGDASVYNALVKMAQTFNRRYTLLMDTETLEQLMIVRRLCAIRNRGYLQLQWRCLHMIRML